MALATTASSSTMLMRIMGMWPPRLPLRVLRYELREDVAGAGQWRGGLGSVREFGFLEDGAAAVEGEGHRYRPWGFLGGKEGMPAKLDLVLPGKAAQALPSKVPHMNIGKDGSFICYGPAGGGYGDPLKRDPAKVADDVLDGMISVETAKRDYGVVVSATSSVSVPTITDVAGNTDVDVVVDSCASGSGHVTFVIICDSKLNVDVARSP